MLSWVLGIEDSFMKSLVYVILVTSAVLIGGSAIYVVMVGLPMYLHKFAFDYAAKQETKVQVETEA